MRQESREGDRAINQTASPAASFKDVSEPSLDKETTPFRSSTLTTSPWRSSIAIWFVGKLLKLCKSGHAVSSPILLAQRSVNDGIDPQRSERGRQRGQ